jgi:hypothetical protein
MLKKKLIYYSLFASIVAFPGLTFLVFFSGFCTLASNSATSILIGSGFSYNNSNEDI